MALMMIEDAWEPELPPLEIINGISTKTIRDIKRIYSADDEDRLIRDLINDKVTLRDDVVVKLQKYYDLEVEYVQ